MDRDVLKEKAVKFYAKWMQDPANEGETWGTREVLADFALGMFEAGQRAERERIVELEEFIRSLESFQSKTLDGYTYHDGFGEEMKEICDMRTKSVLGSGRDLLNAFDAVPKNFK